MLQFEKKLLVIRKEGIYVFQIIFYFVIFIFSSQPYNNKICTCTFFFCKLVRTEVAKLIIGRDQNKS